MTYINKTQPTDISPVEYINTQANSVMIPDCMELLQIFEKVTGNKPVIWGKIIGFGKYHYKQKSTEADWFVTGFAPRASTIAIYINGKVADKEKLEKQLGKFKMSGSCMHIKKLSDIDLAILEKIILGGMKYMKENYEILE